MQLKFDVEGNIWQQVRGCCGGNLAISSAASLLPVTYIVGVMDLRAGLYVVVNRTQSNQDPYRPYFLVFQQACL